MRISPLQIGLVLAGLVALGGLLYVLFFNHTPEVAPQQIAVPSVVHVTPIHSDVSVKEGVSAFAVISEAKAVISGSTVKTSSTGRALIESASSHITRLDYDSQITISEEQRHTQIQLASGAVWSRLMNVFDSGETYDVQTPNAIASVRGTSFGVWYQTNTTILIVIEGEVLFSPLDAPDKAVHVRAGYKATRVGTGPVKVEPLGKADRQLPWVTFNTDTPAVPSPTVTNSGVPTGTTPAPTEPSPTTPTTATQPAPVSSRDLVRLSGINPTSIVEGSQEILTITGRNLDQVETLTIGGTQIYFSKVNTTTITASAPGLTPGRYSVSITAPDGRVSILSSALTVTARATTPNSVTGKP